MSETFGQRLRRLRELKSWSQKDLMGACEWKGGNSRITQYENGTNEPTLAHIATMASALGVTPPYLAYGDVVVDAGKQQRPLIAALGMAADPLTDEQLIRMIQLSGCLKDGIEVGPLASAKQEQKPEDGRVAKNEPNPSEKVE